MASTCTILSGSGHARASHTVAAEIDVTPRDLLNGLLNRLLNWGVTSIFAATVGALDRETAS